MKIILAVDAIHRPLTGIGRYTWEISQGLKASAEVTELKFFSHGRWVQDPADVLAPGPISPISSARKVLASSGLATAAYGMLMPAATRWRLRKHRDYLFHSPNFFLPSCPGPALATFHDLSTLDCPDFHPDVRIAFMRREIPKALRRATALIADSEFTRQRIIDHFKWPEDRVHKVLLGVDHNQYAPSDFLLKKQILKKLTLHSNSYVLCVSTIEPRKNLDRLIHAYGRLPDSVRADCPLVIVGHTGWHSDQTHTLMQACSEAGWLHYLGYLPQEQLPVLLSGCALFVFPSLYEGFGLPVLEAMASAVPVIASDIAPVREFAGNVIRYFDPYDTESITNGLQKALDDSQWRRLAGGQSRQQSLQFTWAKTVRQLIKVYECFPAGE